MAERDVDSPIEPRRPPWWFSLIPEQLTLLPLFILLVPGAWGMWLMSRRQWVEGLIVLMSWGILYYWLAWQLNKSRWARGWVRRL